jgi:hypothetical protein
VLAGPRDGRGGEIARYRAVSYIGAPRSTKMGTTRSPYRYDAAAIGAQFKPTTRLPTTSHCDGAFIAPAISREVMPACVFPRAASCKFAHRCDRLNSCARSRE